MPLPIAAIAPPDLDESQRAMVAAAIANMKHGGGRRGEDFKEPMLLEPANGELVRGHELLVEHDRMRDVSATVIKSKDAAVIDCGGQTLMPGLIDCHVHIIHRDI